MLSAGILALDPHLSRCASLAWFRLEGEGLVEVEEEEKGKQGRGKDVQSFLLDQCPEVHLGSYNRPLPSPAEPPCVQFVGILGAVRACVILRYIPYFYCFSEHFASIPFISVVYSMYTRACTVVSYPFASVAYRDDWNIIAFSHLNHADNLHLLIRFQHSLHVPSAPNHKLASIIYM